MLMQLCMVPLRVIQQQHGDCFRFDATGGGAGAAADNKERA
jgi:hypothetical protein